MAVTIAPKEIGRVMSLDLRFESMVHTPSLIFGGVMLTREQAINKCKEILKNKKGYQMQVAAIAVDVCDINHGGRRVDNLDYSLKEFGKDIGVSHKCITNWVAVYRRIYIKLTTDAKRHSSYTRLAAMYCRVHRDDTRERVNEIYDEEYNKKANDKTLIRYGQEVKCITYFLTVKNGIDLVNPKILQELLFYVEELKNTLKQRNITPKNYKIFTANLSSTRYWQAPTEPNMLGSLTVTAKEVDDKKNGIIRVLKKDGPKRLVELADAFEGRNYNSRKLKAIRFLSKMVESGVLQKSDGLYTLAGI